MSSMSMTTIRSPAFGATARHESLRGRSTFVVLAAILVTIAYAMPIAQSWMSSTEDAFLDVDQMETQATDGASSRQTALAALGLFGLAGVCFGGDRSLRFAGPIAALYVGYLAWCAASCTWAADPALSLRRFVAFSCEVIAGFAVARRASPRQFVWIVFACTLSWLALGLLAELSLGTLRPLTVGYRFAGIFHPNSMGVICALLIMSATYLARGVPRGQRLLWLVAAVSLAFLVLTGSRTALFSMMVAFMVMWLIMAPARSVLVGMLAVVWVASIIWLLLGSRLDDLVADAATMGRVDHDMSSLTGRVPLWNELLPYVAERPLAGYGYNSFWTGDHIRSLSDSQSWSLTSGHSSYIDALLSVGVIGAALCVSTMLLALVRSARLERSLPKAGYGFLAMLLAYALITGVVESIFGMAGLMSFYVMTGICFPAFQVDEAPRLALPG